MSAVQLSLPPPGLTHAAPAASEAPQSRSPVSHLIIIVGENRSFDHLFATYQPRKGESVDNLLSRGIVKADGTPGPNYRQAQQLSADVRDSSVFQIAPANQETYAHLPAPMSGGPGDVCKDNGLCTLAQARATESGLASGYYRFLLTGGTKLPHAVPDVRIEGVHATPPYSMLPSGPFQITNKQRMSYDSYAA